MSHKSNCVAAPLANAQARLPAAVENRLTDYQGERRDGFTEFAQRLSSTQATGGRL
jgi:hypothetical protein